MEHVDAAAYRALQKNYQFLCSAVDPRKLLPEARALDLVSREEKLEIEKTASQRGLTAGMGRLLEITMLKGEKDAFKDFLEVLESNADMKMWAGVLKGQTKRL